MYLQQLVVNAQRLDFKSESEVAPCLASGSVQFSSAFAWQLPALRHSLRHVGKSSGGALTR